MEKQYTPGRNLTSLSKSMQISAFYSMFECVREGGYTFNGEQHDFWECVFVQDGEICVSADERIYNMKKGEIIFHKPMEFHKYHVEKDKHARLFIFSFTLLGSLSAFFENRVFSLTEKQIETVYSLIGFLHEKCSVPENGVIEWYELFETMGDNDLHMHIITNHVYSLFLSICDLAPDSTPEADSESARIFKLAVNYMNKNIDASPGISDIASHCCISETGLKKIFTEYTGIGVHKYFLKLKIKYASNLLTSGISTCDIASRLSFSSQGYFSAAFKRETGLSPKEYRKLNEK